MTRPFRDLIRYPPGVLGNKDGKKTQSVPPALIEQPCRRQWRAGRESCSEPRKIPKEVRGSSSSSCFGGGGDLQHRRGNCFPAKERCALGEEKKSRPCRARKSSDLKEGGRNLTHPLIPEKGTTETVRIRRYSGAVFLSSPGKEHLKVVLKDVLKARKTRLWSLRGNASQPARETRRSSENRHAAERVERSESGHITIRKSPLLLKIRTRKKQENR